jgi:predicted permease
MAWWSRLANVLRPGRLDSDLDEEQRFHIEARAEALAASEGLSREAALERAARQFGHRLSIREESREAKLAVWLESLWRDLALGLRLLRKDAVVSSAAVVSLGLAIGACTAAFALIDALILRELPVRDPRSLVYVARAGGEIDPRFSTLASYPFYERIRDAVAPRMTAFSMSQQSLRQAILPDGGGAEEKLQTQFVSGNAFDVLGVRPVLGRLLRPSDDVTPGAHPVAVVSHAFWTRRLGRRADAVGQWIQLEQRPYQIVGVAQENFTGAQPGVLTDVWVPNMMFHGQSLRSPTWNWLQIWGRLTPGATPDAIRPIVEAALASELTQAPTPGKDPRRQAAEIGLDVVEASTGLSAARHEFQRPLLALAALVGLVLLIACSNVANLLLARGAARWREMALRASIGAGRRRLLQQVLAESGVLTIAASLVGLLCAVVALPLIVGMLSTNENPVYLDARLDWRVVAFVAALGGATTILFGLAPALRASAVRPGGTALAGDRRHTVDAGISRSMVAAQVGCSLMILFVAVLLLRSFDRLLAVDLGFEPERLAVLSLEARDPFGPAEAHALDRRILERVRALPGVESASLAGWALFRGWSWGGGFEIGGRGSAQTSRLAVSSEFFRTMRTPVLDGRELDPRDSDLDRPVPLVVNDAFARKYFGGQRAVGQRLEARGHEVVPYEIVGVVGNARDGSVRGEMGAFAFSPIADPGGALLIRTPLDPRTIADLVRRELPGVHPSLRLVDVTRQTALVASTLLRERLLAVLSAFFAVLGLALSAVGLYGVLTYAVVRRTREIGIRLTLGARPLAVVRSVLGRTARAMASGIAAGLAGGFYFAGFVRTLLYEVEPLSASSIVLPIGCLLAVAMAAAWGPARRATRVDPAEALRTE